eukprot:712647-Ditylum_brightwellii.AAC.1
MRPQWGCVVCEVYQNQRRQSRKYPEVCSPWRTVRRVKIAPGQLANGATKKLDSETTTSLVILPKSLAKFVGVTPPPLSLNRGLDLGDRFGGAASP